MTVQNENTKNIYVGNGSTRVFPYTFHIADKHISYMKVYVEKNGIAKEVTDFSVDAETKTITYPLVGTPVDAESKIVISREVPLVQMLNLVNQGPYFAEDIETALDETVMICQQLKEVLNRTFGVSVSIDVDNVDTTLPYAPGKSFTWNKDGTALELTDNPADVLPQVDNKVVALQEYIQKSTLEINELINSLESTTMEALTALRDECREYADAAEQSALYNVRWNVSETRERLQWKPDYGIDNEDLLLQVPKIIKINVV